MQDIPDNECKNLPPEDVCVRVAFGRFDPLLPCYPHCIFVPTPGRLRIVANVVGCKIGLFGGIAPLARPDGTPYLPPDDGVIDDFVFWEVPRNQDEVFRYDGGAQNVPFLIDTRTPAVLLKRLNAFSTIRYHGVDERGRRYGDYDYCDYIELIAAFVNDLGWVYIPLESEGEFAMFVTAPEKAEWVEQVRKEIGEAAFSLIPDGNRWRWPPINEDQKNRSPRIERMKHGWEPDR